MADYGHDLLFGSFLTPRHDAIPRLVHTAQEAERVGLDLVSGGRMELALGAGGYWDAISAYGGTRLTPGQSLAALSEAIDIIRALWDVSDRSMVNIQGEHYRVVGAKRGPAPAHPIPIWVGGYKPRMLRLIGAKADGWLPSIWNNSLDAVPADNGEIDDAARAAGRDPKEIRRLVNVQGKLTSSPRGLLVGPPDMWVDQLAMMAMEHGFSAFILAGDDTSAYDVIGQEIVPAVREIVAQERAAR
ncbi:LLM class flavin-dependent oxidoreductase [Antribacter sp. KLBMP9083]|uniref:LLM class flavin-dependent oxidoreductase n=1 Tax=Antribacter soli TaxID=2910976 RepID=A0AA41QCA1_9MICO|nr:LLM class flavin-dependent oxidoreductase [Antribacter soli]MCF4120784.1 LLM class flavin-dependent oxidoreductase [Antribacter soli]